MTKDEVNRTYRDGIFRSLFNSEEKLLELYNAISGNNYPPGTTVEIVTLESAIFKGLKNDLAFIIDNRFIILTEQQSTLSPNYPIRLFCYLAEEYKKIAYSKLVFSKTLVQIPTPELYVFYDGKEDAPVEWEMKLSDAFRQKCDKIMVEAVVKVINVNYEKGAELLDKCKTMQEYSLFMYKVNQRYQQTGDLSTAISETIRECIETDILADYLREQKGNIMSVLEVNLTREECEQIRYEDGLIEGEKRGIEKEKLETARRMRKMGLTTEQIKEATGLIESEIENL